MRHVACLEGTLLSASAEVARCHTTPLFSIRLSKTPCSALETTGIEPYFFGPMFTRDGTKDPNSPPTRQQVKDADVSVLHNSWKCYGLSPSRCIVVVGHDNKGKVLTFIMIVRKKIKLLHGLA
mmetsp:Transcript_13217/g.18713  ORF Transcript_13217/g.18713 Transcript_13217/m.18713 type:complete len:123 (+) Transcript_13217:161-529(+)